MNFMDFSDDACLHMFTTGQKQRIHDLFAVSAPRESLLHSAALNKPWNTSASPEPQTNTSPRLSIFPNPATDIITIAFNNQKPLTRNAYVIYNIMGRSLAEGEHTAGIISVKGLTAGTYFIKVHHGEETLVAKFIKQ